MLKFCSFFVLNVRTSTKPPRFESKLTQNYDKPKNYLWTFIPKEESQKLSKTKQFRVRNFSKFGSQMT